MEIDGDIGCSAFRVRACVVLAVSTAVTACTGRVGYEQALELRGDQPAGDAPWGRGEQEPLGGDAAVTTGDATACTVPEVTTACTTASAECGPLEVLDSCGGSRFVDCGGCPRPQACGAVGNANTCGAVAWYPLGTSELGPWTQTISFGSAAGGGVSPSMAISREPSLVVDASGAPVMAWSGTGTGYQTFVARFDGAGWEKLERVLGEGVSGSSGAAKMPVLLLDQSDRLVLAWSDSHSGVEEIYVRRFESGNWLELGTGSASGGGVSNTGTASTVPALAIGADGNPCVVWQEQLSTVAQIYGRQFDGSTWVDLGADSAVAGGISTTTGASRYPSITVDLNGHPVVAWQDETSEQAAIYVKVLATNAWEEMGSGSASGTGVSGTGPARLPSLATSSDGRVFLAWADEESGSSQIHVAEAAATGWVEVSAGSLSGGGISATPSPSVSPRVSVRGPVPMVSWVERAPGGDRAHIRRLGANGWEELAAGSTVATGFDSLPARLSTPVVAVAPDGGLSAAWGAIAGTIGVYYAQLASGVWSGVGSHDAWGRGLSDSARVAGEPVIAIGAGGSVRVAWTDTALGAATVYVREFDGAGWVEAGVGGGSGEGLRNVPYECANPVMGIDSLDRVVLAWSQDTDASLNPAQIHAKRLENGAWTEMGGSATGLGVSDAGSRASQPTLGFLATGEPVLAWYNAEVVGWAIYALQFNGTSWQEIGNRSAQGAGISQGTDAPGHPSLAVDGAGWPVVTWHGRVTPDYEIFVQRFDGAAWGDEGTNSGSQTGISNNAGASRNPVIVVKGDGTPVVAWQDDQGGAAQIYVKEYDGANWVPVGSWASPFSGISNTTGAAISPDMVLDGADRPIVVWADSSSSNYEIYVRRFDGANWVEIAGASASSGGISRSTGPSFSPRIAYQVPSPGAELICVTWLENPGSPQVVLRCSDG